MKTNNHRQNARQKVGHLRRTDTSFAENSALDAIICHFNLVFDGFLQAHYDCAATCCRTLSGKPVYGSRAASDSSIGRQVC
jgi:hypothetical protein